MKKTLFLASALALTLSASAQTELRTSSKDSYVIPAEIYGQFAEHLGRCIYDGIWVGKDSKIPNINGYRKDVVEAFMGTVKASLLKKENVYLRGFGSFIIKARAQKTGRNISKGTTLNIPAHNIPAFKPAKSFANTIKAKTKVK